MERRVGQWFAVAVTLLQITTAFVGPRRSSSSSSNRRLCWVTKHQPSCHATASSGGAAAAHGNSTTTCSTEDPESTPSWLMSRLGISQEQADSIVAGHPPLLTYDINTNLEPTIAFFQDALCDDDNGGGDDDDDATTTSHRRRLATLLCESPGLLEYNVRKRLVPRLALVQSALRAGPVGIDEESLRAIATKTDARFEEWLQKKIGNGDNNEECNDNVHSVDNRNYNDISKRTPSSYMIVSNLQSGGNIGNILRSASIFGCEECIVIGQKRYRLTGDHGSRFNLPRRHMWSHKEARDYLHEKGVRIYGIEIMADASPIMRYDPETGVVEFPFDRQWQGAAFVMGNEGNGLSAKQREICDEFLFIRQTRGGTSSGRGSASLNVACAATVILQAYCTWACYPDALLEGEKFLASSGGSDGNVVH